jgi:hypothetical protein
MTLRYRNGLGGSEAARVGEGEFALRRRLVDIGGIGGVRHHADPGEKVEAAGRGGGENQAHEARLRYLKR